MRSRRRTPPRHPPGQRGFTLIEILVALMIFLAGVSGLLALLTTGLALHGQGLALSRATARLDEVGAEVQRQVAAGERWDAERQAYTDVEAGQLPDGTWYSVVFLPAQPDEPLCVELRVATSRKGLASATPVHRAVDPAEVDAASVQRFLEQARRSP
ncbi:MAG TPA: prepilin-type N-terminal cleavage/methylation domain-containing protein [Planctomycetota bacterium]|jgi:prepilin-type N-terminal cleavage/methylation domain-containing protein|nr:prepilin-type N-terminal cleavage/methylation domain-containing protein [Planctomycetota bacterium]